MASRREQRSAADRFHLDEGRDELTDSHRDAVALARWQDVTDLAPPAYRSWLQSLVFLVAREGCEDSREFLTSVRQNGFARAVLLVTTREEQYADAHGYYTPQWSFPLSRMFPDRAERTPFLLECLDDKEVRWRCLAARWMPRYVSSTPERDRLLTRMADDSSPIVRGWSALHRCLVYPWNSDDREAVAHAFLEALEAKSVRDRSLDDFVRAAFGASVEKGLIGIGSRAVEPLLRCVNRQHWEPVTSIVQTLGRIGRRMERVLPALVRAERHGSVASLEVCTDAINSLVSAARSDLFPAETEEEAFVRAILRDADHQTTALVFADWLADRGDSRGEALHFRVLRVRTVFPEYGELTARIAALEAHVHGWTEFLDRFLSLVRSS